MKLTKMVVTVCCVVWLMVGLYVCTSVGAKAADTMPGRAPMHSKLLAPSAEWKAYYDVVPDGERSLYWTTWKLLEAVRELDGNVRQLEQRVIALESAAKVDPNTATDSESINAGSRE